MPARKCLYCALAALVVLVPLAFIGQGGEVSKASPFGFMVENAGIRLVVDTETARTKNDKPFIPIVIFIGSRGAQSIRLTRAAFTLTDPSGKVSPMATIEQIQDKKNYGFSEVANDYTFIHKTIEVGPNIAAFNGLRIQPGTCFFKNIAGKPSIIRDDLELRPNGWTWALLYFANPAGGNYKLTYTDPTTKGVVVVPFEVDWK